MRSIAVKLVLFVSIAFCLVSCNENVIIPPKDMVMILTKVYLTDGTVSNLDKVVFTKKDTISYYEPIIKSYGYTIAQFDSTIKYYSYSLDEFNEIFDKVIIELTKIEEKYSEKPKNIDKKENDGDSAMNLWTLKQNWDMAIDYKINPHLGFDIVINGLGKYIITFDAQIFEDDSVVNPHFVAYMHNGTTESVLGDIVGRQKFYYKDSLDSSVPMPCSFTFNVTDSLLTIIKGYLYAYDKRTTKPNAIKSAQFNNIFVKYVPQNKSSSSYSPQVIDKQNFKLEKKALLNTQQKIKENDKNER